MIDAMENIRERTVYYVSFTSGHPIGFFATTRPSVEVGDTIEDSNGVTYAVRRIDKSLGAKHLFVEILNGENSEVIT